VTLDRDILHNVMRHASTSTYIPYFIEIKDTFCGRTDGQLRPTLLGRLRSHIKIHIKVLVNASQTSSETSSNQQSYGTRNKYTYL